MIKTTVTKIILSDQESQALLNSIEVIESIYDALIDVGYHATLTTLDGVDIGTEDFSKYLEFLGEVKNANSKMEICDFIINEDIKEM